MAAGALASPGACTSAGRKGVEFEVLQSYLVRNAHREPVADDFELGPTDQELIHAQGHVACVVACGLNDRAFGQLEKVTDCKSDYRHFKAESAW